jgi:hypothetical protein
VCFWVLATDFFLSVGFDRDVVMSAGLQLKFPLFYALNSLVKP